MSKFDIRVTKIDNRWHARLMENEIVHDEMACSIRSDIGWICREMLRWADKTGHSDDWTSSARKRQISSPKGKIWYQNKLNETYKQ